MYAKTTNWSVPDSTFPNRSGGMDAKLGRLRGGNHVKKHINYTFLDWARNDLAFRALRGDGECAKSQESLHETRGGLGARQPAVVPLHACGWDSTKRFIVFSTQNSSQNRANRSILE